MDFLTQLTKHFEMGSQPLVNPEPIQSDIFLIKKARVRGVICSGKQTRIYLENRERCFHLSGKFFVCIGDDVKIVYQLSRVSIYSRAKIISMELLQEETLLEPKKDR